MEANSNQLISNDSNDLDSILVIIRKVVSRYVARNAIPLREKEDVEMAVVEKFLKKRTETLKAFKGNSKLTTYYTAIINRMCCEIIRKEQKNWYIIHDGHQEEISKSSSTQIFESEKNILIKEEVKRLANTLLFFNGTMAKVTLFLKYYFDIPLEDIEIKSYNTCKFNALKSILSQRSSLSKTSMFENMAQAIHIAEQKKIGKDAARMWLNKHIEIILSRMNANGLSSHTKESLAILLEMQNYRAYNRTINIKNLTNLLLLIYVGIC